MLEKGNTFEIIRPIKLRYIYKQSSSYIAAGRDVPVVPIPEDITLNYNLHVTFIKIYDGRYNIHSFAVSGLSPWSHFRNRKINSSNKKVHELCTTAVNISKPITSEEDLELVMEKLQTSVESCCLPDLEELKYGIYDSTYENMDKDTDEKVISALIAFVYKNDGIKLNWGEADYK